MRVNGNDLELDFGDGDTYLWQGQPFTGVGFDQYPDGSRWSEVEYVEGWEHGIGRVWYPSGQLEVTSFYQGRLFGPEREWDAEGQLRSEIIYEYSYALRERKWDEAGRLVSEKHLQQDPVRYSRLEATQTAYDALLTINKEEWLNR